MIKKGFIFLLLLPFSLLLAAQDSSYTLKEIRVLPDSATDFTVDNLGNVYLLRPGQQIKKLGDQYDSVGVYNDVRRYGKLFSFDASNPLKILLFYKDFNTIVVLDRFLNIRNSIDLRQSGIFQVSAIATSFDNNIWLFDELENKIKKIDDNGKLLLESPDFRILYDVPPHPDFLVDFNKYLYAYDSSRGLLSMDYFGANKNLLAFTGWKQVQALAQGLVALDDKGLVYYQPGQLNVEAQALPRTILQAQKIRLHGSRLFALQKDKRIHIYQLAP